MPIGALRYLSGIGDGDDVDDPMMEDNFSLPSPLPLKLRTKSYEPPFMASLRRRQTVTRILLIIAAVAFFMYIFFLSALWF